MIVAVKFNNELELTNDPHDDGEWLLVEDFRCTLTWDHGHNIYDMKTLMVPAGFRTDLASTPRVLWAVIPPFGRWDEAAVLHDHLYGGACSITREDADAALYFGMTECNVPQWKAWVMWASVRVFGGWWFRG